MKTLIAVMSVAVAMLLFGFSRKQPPTDPPPSGGTTVRIELAGLTPVGLAVANVSPQQLTTVSQSLQTPLESLQSARTQLSTAMDELSAAVSAARADSLNPDSAGQVLTARATVASRRAAVAAADDAVVQTLAATIGAEQAAILRRVTLMAERRLPASFAAVNMDAATLRKVARGARLAYGYVQGVDLETGEAAAPDSPVALFNQIRDRTDVLAAEARLTAAGIPPSPIAPPR